MLNRSWQSVVEPVTCWRHSCTALHIDVRLACSAAILGHEQTQSAAETGCRHACFGLRCPKRHTWRGKQRSATELGSGLRKGFHNRNFSKGPSLHATKVVCRRSLEVFSGQSSVGLRILFERLGLSFGCRGSKLGVFLARERILDDPGDLPSSETQAAPERPNGSKR